MLALDRDALICDMAEVYRLYDIKSVPLPMLATFASGLGINSRIEMKRAGLKAPLESFLLAKILDVLVGDERNRITPLFMEKKKEKEAGFRAFDSIEEFEAARAEIIKNSNIEKEVIYGGD